MAGCQQPNPALQDVRRGRHLAAAEERLPCMRTKRVIRRSLTWHDIDPEGINPQEQRLPDWDPGWIIKTIFSCYCVLFQELITA
jgi:hypothetical protein